MSSAHSLSSTAPPTPPGAPRSDWGTLAKLLPYVWQWRWRVLVALTCLVAAKFANIGVPLVLKQLVDALDLKPGDPRVALAVPVALLLAYGALRLSITAFTELREFLFYPVAARIARRVSLEAFEHLLALSLRFHLERQTGGVSRDIERGSRSIQSLLNFTIYNILPTLFEITLVIVPATTPTVARHTSSSTAVEMIRLCPRLSTDSEVCDLIAAVSRRRRLSS